MPAYENREFCISSTRAERARRIIVHHGIDPGTHRKAPHKSRIARLQHFRHRPHIPHSRIQPNLVAPRFENDRHSIVDSRSHSIRRRGQNRAGLQHLAAWVSPAIPQTRKREQLPLVDLETIGLLGLARPHPLVESIRRKQTSSRFQRIAKSRFLRHSLGSGVDHPRRARQIFRPTRNQSPAHQRQLSCGFLRVLSDNHDRLRGRNVVSRDPVFLA